MQAEPRPPHGEVMQRLGFILKTWQKVMNLIHEDKPGFVVLRTFSGKTVPTLLSKRLFGEVFRDLHAFDLHADVMHKDWVAAEFMSKVFLHVAHTLTNDHAKALTLRHLVNQFKSCRAIAKVQLQPAGMFLVQNTFFVTFHRKGDAVRNRDRVNAVSVAVEVEFENFLRVEVTDVRAKSGGVLIFRSIYQNAGPSIRSGLNRKLIHTM